MAKVDAAAEVSAPPRDVPVTVAAPLLSCCVLFVLACLFGLAGRLGQPFSPWWLALVGLAGYLVAATEVRTMYSPVTHGPYMRGAAQFVTLVGSAVSTAWLVWAGHVGAQSAWPMLLVAAAPVTVLWWWLRWRAERAADQISGVAQAAADAAFLSRWPAIIAKSDDGATQITAIREHRAGVELTVEPVETDGRSVKFSTFAAHAEQIATDAAVAYRRVSGGKRLPRNAVRIEPGCDDAEFRVHVTMRDVFNVSTTYTPDASPRRIVEALDLGEFEDAARIMLELLGTHTWIVGATGSGKSVVANNIIGRITACADALAWVGATDKLMPLIYPWLASWYDGAADRPALDYVAGTTSHEVRRMLRAAYKLTCERNDRLTHRSKMTPTPREPAVFVLVEEVSHAVEFAERIPLHDGQEASITELLLLIARAGRSAGVHLVLMSQTALNDSLGEQAAQILRQLTTRICLRTMKSYDGTVVLPGLTGVDSAQIPLHTMLVQTNIAVPRATPGKAPALEETPTVGPVAVRQAAWRPDGVEPESDLGPDYEGRWDVERQPTLARAVAADGLSWRVPQRLVGYSAGQPVAVAPAAVPPGSADEPAGGTGSPTGTPGGSDRSRDGEGEDMEGTFTAADEEAFRAMLGEQDGGGDTDQPDREAERRSQAFRLPDPSDAIDGLWRRARELHDPPGTDQPARPVPTPLREVVVWLDRERIGPAGFVLTAELAEGIGWTDGTHALGLALGRVGCRSRTARSSEDPRRRGGYEVAGLREVAARHRFGL